MASVVQVCNRALQKLGTSERITSLSDNLRNARSMSLVYEDVRDKLLRKYTWAFAKRRAQLAANSEEPVFGPANAFPVPADFLRLCSPDPEDNFNTNDWRIENHEGQICVLTNDGAPLDVTYVARITDPNLMDSLFRDLWSTEIAFETCQEITGSNTKKESLREDRKEILLDAVRTNAMENPASAPPEDPWITVRA